jgi:hypothetical protein
MPSRNPLPPLVVPLFPAALERRIKALLATRLGREGTDEELAAYRQGLWVMARLLAHAAERITNALTPFPMSRTAIYARKSTESDDRQVQSLDAQLHWALTRCAELGPRFIHSHNQGRSTV